MSQKASEQLRSTPVALQTSKSAEQLINTRMANEGKLLLDGC